MEKLKWVVKTPPLSRPAFPGMSPVAHLEEDDIAHVVVPVPVVTGVREKLRNFLHDFHRIMVQLEDAIAKKDLKMMLDHFTKLIDVERATSQECHRRSVEMATQLKARLRDVRVVCYMIHTEQVSEVQEVARKIRKAMGLE